MILRKKYILTAAILSVLLAVTACAAPAVTSGTAGAESKTVESIAENEEEGETAESEEEPSVENEAETGADAEDADTSEAESEENAEDAEDGKTGEDGIDVASTDRPRTAVDRKRAYGPEKDPLDVSIQEPAGQASSEEIVMPQEEVLPAGTGDSSANSIAFMVKQDVKNVEIPYLNYYPRTEQMIENQLQEMASYMESNQTEAAHFLSRLPRFRYMSQMLDGTDDYYYWGEQDKDGAPNGIGIAVYADNCYYYGSFENGVRSGRGTWFQTFIAGSRYSMLNNGILCHSYVGDWAGDLPNGKGQEHLDIDLRYLEARVTTNVIGTFKDGLYDGEEYLTTIEPDGNEKDWNGVAKNGVFEAAGTYQRTTAKDLPVCVSTTDSNNYIWILESVNHDQGITGLR